MTTPHTKPNSTHFGRITTSGLITTLILIAACLVPDHGKASDMPPVPDAPCTLGERMNIHLVDGWMYECGCSVLATGFHCEWNLVGQIGTALIIDKRPPRKHRIHKPAKHHRVVRFPLPAVVR